MHSAYSQCTYRSVLCILSIGKDSFRLFSVYKRIHSVYSQYMNSKIYLEELPHSAYSLYAYRFFLQILSIGTDLFRVFSVYVQIHSAYSESAPK